MSKRRTRQKEPSKSGLGGVEVVFTDLSGKTKTGTEAFGVRVSGPRQRADVRLSKKRRPAIVRLHVESPKASKPRISAGSGAAPELIQVLLPLTHDDLPGPLSNSIRIGNWLVTALMPELVTRFALDSFVWAGEGQCGGLALLAALQRTEGCMGAVAHDPWPLDLATFGNNGDATEDDDEEQRSRKEQHWQEAFAFEGAEPGLKLRISHGARVRERKKFTFAGFAKRTAKVEAVRIYLAAVGCGWVPKRDVHLEPVGLGGQRLEDSIWKRAREILR